MIELLQNIPAAVVTGVTAVVTTIITAAITLIAVYFTNRANTQRALQQLDREAAEKRQDFRRERLEELYLFVDGWLTNLVTYYLPYISVMRGDFDYNKALDMTIEQGKNNQVDFKRIQMIVDLYFPSFRPDLANVLTDRDRANSVLGEHKAEYKKGNLDGMRFVGYLRAEISNIEKSGAGLKERIVELARLA